MVARSEEADGDRGGEDFAEERVEEVDPDALAGGARLPRPFHSWISASFSRDGNLAPTGVRLHDHFYRLLNSSLKGHRIQHCDNFP